MSHDVPPTPEQGRNGRWIQIGEVCVVVTLIDAEILTQWRSSP